MGRVELNFQLTDEQKALQDGARKFFMEVWRPAAIELDRMPDPQQVIARESKLWDVMRESYRLGYHKMGLPVEIGGLGLDSLTLALIEEEMGYAAVDFAIAIGTSIWPFLCGISYDVAELKNLTLQFCADTEAKYIGCWAITEPDHGSDWFLSGEDYCRHSKPVPQVTVTRRGSNYVINGQKAAWVSNGNIASHALLFFGSQPGCSMDDCGLAVVPLDLPGVSRGRPLDKLGQRALNQGEIFFDDVSLPAPYVVICSDHAAYKITADMVLASANGGMSSYFTGLAQAAFDEALKYAKERVQGGQPIFNHQAIKLRLFEMFIEVEAARYLSRSAATYNAQALAAGQSPAVHYAIAAKAMSTETSFRVASKAVQIFGGMGVSKECHIEKIFRDARASMIEDGVNETLGIRATEWL